MKKQDWRLILCSTLSVTLGRDWHNVSIKRLWGWDITMTLTQFLNLIWLGDITELNHRQFFLLRLQNRHSRRKKKYHYIQTIHMCLHKYVYLSVCLRQVSMLLLHVPRYNRQWEWRSISSTYMHTKQAHTLYTCMYTSVFMHVYKKIDR